LKMSVPCPVSACTGLVVIPETTKDVRITAKTKSDVIVTPSWVYMD